jgi:hypothetical protein
LEDEEELEGEEDISSDSDSDSVSYSEEVVVDFDDIIYYYLKIFYNEISILIFFQNMNYKLLIILMSSLVLCSEAALNLRNHKNKTITNDNVNVNANVNVNDNKINNTIKIVYTHLYNAFLFHCYHCYSKFIYNITFTFMNVSICTFIILFKDFL